MIITSGEAVEIAKLTAVGVGRGENGPRVQVVLDLRMQVEEPQNVAHGSPVIARAILDSVDFGDSDGESRNTLSVRIGRDFPRMLYRFCAIGVSAVAGEEGARLDPSGEIGMRVDRVAVLDGSVKGTPEARVVSGVLELRWKVEGMLELNDFWRLGTMIGVDAVTLTTSSVQANLFENEGKEAH
jgi:hypothetical protein